MTDEPHPYRTSDRRVIPGLLFGLVAMFGALYVAGYYVTSDRIPRGTTVDGIDIGGLTPAAAQRRLRDGLERPGRRADHASSRTVSGRASRPSAAGLAGRRTRHRRGSRRRPQLGPGADVGLLRRRQRRGRRWSAWTGPPSTPPSPAVADKVDVPAIEG